MKGCAKSKISAPKSSLFDLHDEVQVLDNSRRRFGVLGSQSLPIVGLRLLVLWVKSVLLFGAHGASQRYCDGESLAATWVGGSGLAVHTGRQKDVRSG